MGRWNKSYDFFDYVAKYPGIESCGQLVFGTL